MPGKGQGKKGGGQGQATVGEDSISLAEPGPFRLGDVVHPVWTVADPTNVQGQVTVQVATGGQSTNVANSGDPVTLGPTPTWGDPQPGTLHVTLLRWVDQGPGVDAAGFETVATDPVTYDIVV